MISARRRFAAGPLGVTLVILTGCSSGPATADGPWQAEIRTAHERATSDFEKDVLSDGSITREEYTEALDLWVTCMTDLGLSASLEPGDDGIFTYTVRSADGDIDRQNDECRVGTVAEIEPLYVDMLRNPENATLPEMMRSCLIEAGTIDSSFTSTEMEGEMDALIRGTSSIFDASDPRVAECVSDPF